MSYFVKCSNLEQDATNLSIKYFSSYNSALDYAELKVQEGFSTTVHSGSTHVHVYPVQEDEESTTPVEPTPEPTPVAPSHELQNALHLGIKEGENLNAIDLQHNGYILQKAATDGKSIYFPSGSYEFDRSVKWLSKKNISISGDGKSSKIIQRNVGARPGMFRFESCQNVSVSSIQLVGTNALGYVPESATKNEYAIYGFRSKNISIHDCDIWGWPTDKTIFFRDCWCVKVNNCLLYYNVSRAKDGADIYVSENQSPFEDNITRYIEITNNRLLSNNLGGILCTSSNSGLIVSNNTVVTCDENMVEIQNPNLINRKEGIELHYSVSNADGNNRDVNETICSNNLVKNTRWAGIYCNNSVYGSNNPGGIKGSITGNTIINTCQEIKKYQVANKRAGICIQQHQQLVISNNVIRDIGPDATNGQEHAGIILECTTPKTKNINCSAIVSNNTINSVKGHGILVGNSGGKYNITNNIVQDCEKLFLYANKLAKGGLHIEGNTFLNELENYSYHKMVSIAGGKEGNINFINNTVSSEDKVIFANSVILFHCAPSKANISSNKFIGPAAHTTNVRAMYLDVIKKAGRHMEMVLQNNYICNARYGIYGGGTPATYAGPTVMEGTTWDNVVSKISSDSDDYLFEGERTFDGRCNIYWDTNPKSGVWLRGDNRVVKNPSVDSAYNYCCTKGGNGTNSQWTGGAKLRNR